MPKPPLLLFMSQHLIDVIKTSLIIEQLLTIIVGFYSGLKWFGKFIFVNPPFLFLTSK